jgi:Homeodomain-like domain
MTEIQADLLVEHLAGATIRQIAKKRGIPRSTVARIVKREGDRLIGDLENDLRVAELTEAKGGEGHWPTCLIPPQLEADRRAALSLLFWARDQLVARGWPIETIVRHVPSGGTAFMLTTTPGRGS